MREDMCCILTTSQWRTRSQARRAGYLKISGVKQSVVLPDRTNLRILKQTSPRRRVREKKSANSWRRHHEDLGIEAVRASSKSS